MAFMVVSFRRFLIRGSGLELAQRVHGQDREHRRGDDYRVHASTSFRAAAGNAAL